MPKQNDIEFLFRKESIASIIINAIGAFITFFYLNVIDPAPTAQKSIRSLDGLASFIFVAIVATSLFIGISWGNKHKRNFKKWYRFIESGEKSSADIPQKIKRDILNFPLYAAGITAMMWLSSSLIAAYVTSSYRVFIGLFGWGGFVAAALLFFVDDLLWRPIIPVFFPNGNLRSVPAFHLPIFWKLLVVFLFIGILPPALLVRLTWQRVNTLFLTPNPERLLENLRILQIFILGASVAASIGLAFFITRGITNPIETLRKAMERVQEDNLDTKVMVVTNDELGYLGEHFNQMTAELRQKEELRNTNALLKDQLEKIKLLEVALREQATRDPLTGLFNRRYMIEALERELLRASRQGIKLSVVMLDLDNLKQINDTHGHVEGGDQSLKTLANTLQELCRSEDTVCRYAGDEFIVILYDTSAEVAYERTLEWKDVLSRKRIKIGGENLIIAFSAGVVECPSRQISAEELLDCADQALYQAKKAGRNQVAIYIRATESVN